MKIVGRIREQQILKRLYESKRPEFVAIYGRRRVGKTYLVNESFSGKFTFKATASPKSSMRDLLANFASCLNEYGVISYPVPANWFQAFEYLWNLIRSDKSKGKKVIFIDELPWFDTPRSQFIQALEHFWNHWASTDGRVMLIVCGSATSWMMDNLIDDVGGLYNRVTSRIKIEPFTLKECEEYFQYNGIPIDRYTLLECYMVFGGIPFYLNYYEKGLSLAQNIDNLFFASNAQLRDEYDKLFSSLFRNSGKYRNVVEALATKSKGLKRDEIIKKAKLESGGSATKILKDLVDCGFIRSYRSFGKKNNGEIFQLVDFFSLFHIKFIKNYDGKDPYHWEHKLLSTQHRSWSGYAFEQVCLSHIDQIRKALGAGEIASDVSAWRGSDSDGNACQIDLVIDRADMIINLCEMKYSVKPFVISKKYAQRVRESVGIFTSATGTTKAICQTFVTTFGVEKGKYYSVVQREVTMDDLFK